MNKSVIPTQTTDTSQVSMSEHEHGHPIEEDCHPALSSRAASGTGSSAFSSRSQLKRHWIPRQKLRGMTTLTRGMTALRCQMTVSFVGITVFLLLLWQLIVSFFQLPDFILPSPKEVFITLYQQRALLATESTPTLIEIFLGLLLGVIVGCVGGIVTANFRPLKTWLLPLLILSQAIPTFVIAPLLVIWLGYGLTAKIITSMLMIFFPVASATYDGLQQTPTDWLALARTMNARPWQVFLRIKWMAALPSIASGIRIAATAAPLGAIIGEWVGASHGLGYLMLNANARMDIALMFSSVIILILMSLFLYFTIDRGLKKIVWWV